MRRIENPEEMPRRCMLIGAPKTGKTTLATSLPWGSKLFGERAVYVALDPGSEGLDAVLTPNREHLLAVKPEGDPLTGLVEIATHDWAAEGFGTIIVDTWTCWAEEILSMYAKLQNFAKEQITFGKARTPTYHVHPVMGDYGAAQNSLVHVLRFFLAQPLTLISVFHEDWHQASGSNPDASTIGGPGTVGHAQIRTLPKLFDSVVRLEVATQRRISADPKKASVVEKFLAHTTPHDIWIAGVRTPGEPIGTIELKRDPLHFWETYLEAIGASQ